MDWEELKHFKVNLEQSRIAILIAIIFAITMSIFVSLKFFTMSYPNFDLGISYRTMELFLRYHMVVMPQGLGDLTTPKPYSKLIYIVLSPTLILYDSPVTIVVDQVLFIAVGGFTTFKIFQVVTSDTRSGILMEIVYFLYYPLYGFLSNGGNLMVFFTPLLLMSYYFFLTNRMKFWLIFTILAAISNTIAPFLVLIVYFVIIPLQNEHKLEILRNFVSRLKGGEKPQNINNIWPLILLFSIVALLGFLISRYGLIGLLAGENIKLGTTLQAHTPINLLFTFKDITFVEWQIYLRRIYEYLTPFLFLPLSNLFVVIFFLFILVGNQTGNSFFTSPTSHHTSLIIPLIFLGMSRALSNVSLKRTRRIIYVIFVVNLAFFLVYSPFGYNDSNWSGSHNAGNVLSEIEINRAEILTNEAFSSIPLNSTVFLDAHAPALYGVYNLYSLSSGGVGGAGLASPYSNESVNYVVLYPIPINAFYGQWSMYNRFWSNYFLQNASYGVYSDIMGNLILKNNYNASVKYYSPYEYDLYASSLLGFVNYNNTSNHEIFIPASDVLLPPGYFNVSVDFTIPLEDLSANKSMAVTSYKSFIDFGDTTFKLDMVKNGCATFSASAKISSNEYGHINLFLNLTNKTKNNYIITNVSTTIHQIQSFRLSP
jgi:uncharacterized membrane protein